MVIPKVLKDKILQKDLTTWQAVKFIKVNHETSCDVELDYDKIKK